MPRWPTWVVAVLRYERGVAKVAFEMSLKKPVWWKAVVSCVVIAAVSSVIVSDFGVVTKGSEADYGVKAAISALGAAAMVFISLIPSRPKPRPLFEHILRALSGCFAFMAGVFWLLSETSGRLGPYMIVVMSIGLAMSIGIFFTIAVSSMVNWESKYLELRRDEGNRSADDQHGVYGRN